MAISLIQRITGPDETAIVVTVPNGHPWKVNAIGAEGSEEFFVYYTAAAAGGPVPVVYYDQIVSAGLIMLAAIGAAPGEFPSQGYTRVSLPDIWLPSGGQVTVQGLGSTISAWLIVED